LAVSAHEVGTPGRCGRPVAPAGVRAARGLSPTAAGSRATVARVARRRLRGSRATVARVVRRRLRGSRATAA